MLYEYECPECHKKFELFLSVDQRDSVNCCGVKCIRFISNFHTNDDLMYQFNADYFGNRPVNIYSRSQYKGLLKQHGLADCTIKDCLSVKKKKDSDYKPERKKLAEKISKRLHQEGLAKHVRPAMLHKVKTTLK